MNPLRNIVLTLVAAASCVPTCQALSEPDAWRLAPGAFVDGSGIFLDQLVVPSHDLPALPHIRLAPAPALGQTNLLTREEVIGLARDVMPGLDSTNWAGPAQVLVSRRMRPLAEFQILQLLTDSLQSEYVRDRGNVSLELGQPWTPVSVPDDALSVRVTDLPQNGLLPNLYIGFEIWAGQERVGSWRVAMRAKIWRDVPVARSLLLRGQLLRDADISLERCDVLQHRDLATSVSDPSLELTENIPAGNPIPAHALRLRPIIRRGQMVDAIYHDGALTISLKVQTLEDGALGQTVRVLNIKTNRELFGRIENEETVLITL